MHKKLLALAVSVSLSGPAIAYYQQQPGGYAPPENTLRGHVSFVPAGTPVQARINSTLSSEFSSVGETFTATLSGPIYAGSQLVAGPGSTVQGQVVNVTPAGRGGKPGSIDLRISSVITADGRRYPLSASIDQANYQLSAEGGRLSHMTKATAVGAGAGALSGLIGSSISGGKKGKGTAIGTGIGAGVGLLGGAFKKGQDFILKSGTTVPFVLDEPMQVNAGAPPQMTAPQYAAPSGSFAPPAGYGSQPNYGGQPSYPSGGFADPGAQQSPHQQNPYL